MADPRALPGCPDAEELAAFLDDRVDADRRAAIRDHLADCPDCQEWLAESVRVLEALPVDTPEIEVPAHGRWQRWAGWAGWTAAAAAALVAAFWLPAMWRPNGLRDLVDAVGSDRTIETRLSGGFAYGRLRSPSRGPDGPDLAPDVRIAAARLEKAAESDPSPENLHALGIALAIQDRLDEAMTSLEEALVTQPDNAVLLGDLAATSYARGQAANRPDDLARALDYVERSIRLSDRAQRPPSPEVLFNRAVILESLSLRAEARAAWTAYLEADAASEWADEARRRLGGPGTSRHDDQWPAHERELASASPDAAVPAEVLDGFRQELRELTEDLLIRWATEARSSERVLASTAVERARTYAFALERATSDPLLRDAVAAVGNGQSVTARRGLVEGYTLLGEGRRASDAFEFDRARPIYLQAVRAFEAGRSPASLWARFFAAQAEYYARRLVVADRELADLAAQADRAGYLALEGRVRWLRGLVAQDEGRFADATHEYVAAAACFARLGEPDNSAAVRSLVSDNLRVMGDYRGSWAHRADVLARVPAMRQPARATGALLATARLAEFQRLSSAALVFENAALETAARLEAPAALAQVLLRRAETLLALDERDAAARDLADVRASLDHVTDRGILARLRAEQLWLQASLGGPIVAVRDLTTALSISRDAGLVNHLPRILLARARAHVALGERALAADDLAAGVDVFESQRGRTPVERLRVSYFDTGWDLFIEMVSLLDAQGDTDRAFEFAERGRGRSLQDHVTGPDATSPARAMLQRELSPSVRVVFSAVMPDRVLHWVLWRGGHELVRTTASGPEVVTLARQYTNLLARSSRSARLSGLSARLYDVLVRPVEHLVPPGTETIVIPDPQLAAVPYGALIDSVRQTYWIERNPIGYAPTARVLEYALRSVREQPADGESLAVIAGGDFEGRRPLSAIRDETRAIVTAFPGAIVWAEQEATKARFLSALAGNTVVHFSGHAVANPEFPDLSFLWFSSEPRGEQQLPVFELQSAGASRARLVVLAACSTSAGAMSLGEGVLGLARPVLASGVPAVVATMWDVEDGVSAEVFSQFYTELARGADSVRALQSAQVAMLARLDPRRVDPRGWAAFVALGAPYSTARHSSIP